MKRVVVYQSSTGFTKQYAEWIAQELSCEAMPLKAVPSGMADEQDCIIFGGWVMGNMIMGLDKIRKSNAKKLVVFAVGSSREEEDIKDALISQNNLGDKPFFYMEGGFRFEKLNFIYKTILKTIKKSLMKKENKTEREKSMEQMLCTSFDHSDKKYIAPLISYVRETE